MRIALLALLVTLPASSTSAPASPLWSSPDVQPPPAEVLDLLGRCDDELPALDCHVDERGHGYCDPLAHQRFVELDVCDASGAFAAHGYVCGVRWSDCVWCVTNHELVLPWRAGPWPADLSPTAPWSRRAAACRARLGH